MGLNPSSLVAPRPHGVLDPATGKPVGASDPFFGNVSDQLADKPIAGEGTRAGEQDPHRLL